MSSSPEPATTPSPILPSSTAVTSSSASSVVTSSDDDYDPNGFPPMTTHWTPPASCTWTYSMDELPQPGATGAVAWLDLKPVPGDSSLSCYPEGMFYNDRTGVFSPGTCPGGWYTARNKVESDVGDDDITTVAVCCSSEYSLQGSQCVRSVPTVIAVPISYNKTAHTYEVLSNSTTTLYSATIAVYTIRAMFREEDKELLGLTGEDEIGSKDSTSKLSLSTKVGIGVGVAIFALLTIGLGVFFYWRKKSANCRAKRRMAHTRGGAGAGDESNGDVPYGAGVIPLRPCRRSNDEPPPPAYDASTESNSLGDGEGRSPPPRDHEIQVLKAQKAAIQRRLEELEHVDTGSSPNDPDSRSGMS